MTRIGVIGSGIVGQVLADGFLKHKHAVMRASRDILCGQWTHAFTLLKK